jgi:hypothetical protein
VPLSAGKTLFVCVAVHKPGFYRIWRFSTPTQNHFSVPRHKTPIAAIRAAIYFTKRAFLWRVILFIPPYQVGLSIKRALLVCFHSPSFGGDGSGCQWVIFLKDHGANLWNNSNSLILSPIYDGWKKETSILFPSVINTQTFLSGNLSFTLIQLLLIFSPPDSKPLHHSRILIWRYHF